jgi:hypothetical protein
MASISDEDFTNKLITAFSNKKLYDLVNGKANELLDRMDKRLLAVEEKTEVIEAKTDSVIKDVDILKSKIDDFEQRDRSRTLILSGKDICDASATSQGIVDLLNGLLKTDISIGDIEYTWRVSNENGVTRTRVVFKTEAKKKEVIKKRKALKSKNIWLADDLTQHRSNLAYMARKAVKNNMIKDSWTTDGKVFIKMLPDGPVKKLTDARQLPK